MVAVAIFADNGELYLMGKSRESAISCVQAGVHKPTFRYIEDEANGKYNSRGIAGHS